MIDVQITDVRICKLKPCRQSVKIFKINEIALIGEIISIGVITKSLDKELFQNRLAEPYPEQGVLAYKHPGAYHRDDLHYLHLFMGEG